MSELALRPRSATELVDAAFQVYRRAPLQFMVALALVYVPWLVIRLVFGIDLNVAIDAKSVPPTSTIVTIAVVAISTYAIAGGVITAVARDVYLDLPVNVAEAFRMVATRLVTLIVASVIVVLMLSISFIFFFLPVLYVLSRLAVVRQVIMLEDGGVGRSVSRSFALSVGLKLHTLGTLALIGLLLLAVNLGADVLFNIIPSHVVQNVLSTTLAVVVGPIIGITETVLYYDLRIRREGFDVEYLVGRDGTPPVDSANVAP